MELSLITSLYRGEAHLPAYGQHIQRVLAQLREADLTAEILVIANDPTPAERALLADLPVRVIETARETLYASWNRALTLIQADIFGMWNIDDVRDGEALIRSYAMMTQGYTLVDTPMHVHTHTTRQTFVGTQTLHSDHIRPSFIHDTTVFTRKHCMNPFALIHRDLLAQVGPFDPHFRVVGDLEWSGRAQAMAQIGVLPMPGGTFNLHGSNLSSTGSARQMVEENIVFLRRQQWEEVRPTPDAAAMREMWDTWGNPDGIVVPPHIAEMLWGPQADYAWAQWQHTHHQQQRRLVWRQRAKTVINQLGLSALIPRQKR